MLRALLQQKDVLHEMMCNAVLEGACKQRWISKGRRLMMYHVSASSLQSSSQLLFARLINQIVALHKGKGNYQSFQIKVDSAYCSPIEHGGLTTQDKNQSTTWAMDDLRESAMPLDKEEVIAKTIDVSSCANGELAAKQETTMVPVKSGLCNRHFKSDRGMYFTAAKNGPIDVFYQL